MSRSRMERLDEKQLNGSPDQPSELPQSRHSYPAERRPVSLLRAITWALLLLLPTYHLLKWTIRAAGDHSFTQAEYGHYEYYDYPAASTAKQDSKTAVSHASSAPYGVLPLPDDPFLFIPCTDATLPPALDDPEPAASWGRLYDPNPAHWSWGNVSSRSNSSSSSASNTSDPYAGRGIYLCGYLDVPLDWTNRTADPRIARLAVTKYQVGGLVRRHGTSAAVPPTLPRSNRTIVVEPGGPGGSGTSYVWRAAEATTARLSNGTLDVLGWDPRGVNTSLPRAACFPHNADRDRWLQLTNQYRNSSGVVGNTLAQLQVADAMNEAVFAACAERLGDLPRFLGTGLVARDLDAIREALGEPLLTGYLVSYGTGIGQTYAQLFPDRVGRVVLDGTEYVPDEWALAGFGWTSLDNVTDAYRDGFLGACVEAGPKHCALAAAPVEDDGPGDGTNSTLPTALELEARIAALVARVAERPVVAYTPGAGPSMVTYAALVEAIYGALYRPQTWPGLAAMLYELEQGNATLAARMLDGQWEYDPDRASSVQDDCSLDPAARPWARAPGTDELTPLVICADAYDAPPPGLAWYDALWANMTAQSWISGNARFFNVLPCRHFTRFWPAAPAGVYRGALNHTLAHPVLLVAETHDPATPLHNGRRLARAMGYGNARLVVHHGYGHASMGDPSSCTDAAVAAYIMNGTVPFAWETHCLPNEKPYLYGVKEGDDDLAAAASAATTTTTHEQHLAVWRSHMEEMALWNPRLARHGGRQ